MADRVLAQPVGICSSQFISYDCAGLPDPTFEDVVFCGLTDVAITPSLTDGLTIQEDSGIPGKRCLDIEIDPIVRHYDVSITTCSRLDVRLDYMLGNSDMMLNADGVPFGSKAKKKATQACVCSCESDESCLARSGLIIWSLNVCGDSTTVQPAAGGRYWVTILTGIQWRPTTNPIISLSANQTGRQYSGRSYENNDFGQGPGNILPADELGDIRCWYQIPTDQCPPGGCDCGLCGEGSPTPLAYAA